MAGTARIPTRDGAVATWIIPTDEELMIARHTRTLAGLWAVCS